MKKWHIGFLLVIVIAACSLNVWAAPNPDWGHGPGGPGGPGGPDQHQGPGQHDEHDQHIGGPNQHHDDHNQGLRHDARSILQRTAKVLQDAQDAVSHHHFNKGLGLALAHQDRARDLYRDGNYLRAIFHSLRARKLAFEVIRKNGRRINWQYWWNETERRYMRQSPSDERLDRDLRREHRGKIRKDDDAVHFRINLNFDL